MLLFRAPHLGAWVTKLLLDGCSDPTGPDVVSCGDSGAWAIFPTGVPPLFSAALLECPNAQTRRVFQELFAAALMAAVQTPVEAALIAVRHPVWWLAYVFPLTCVFLRVLLSLSFEWCSYFAGALYSEWLLR